MVRYPSYACGEGWIHEEFGTMIEPLASRLPYMVTAGNHEVCVVGLHSSTAFQSWLVLG